ncbi:MAG: alpha/beta hydrolase-fold protein [Phycisphaeraceae bacterium]
MFKLLPLVLIATTAFAEPNWQTYTLGPESTARGQGVPQGKVTEHVFKDSKVFPGTIRRYSVYIPAQYAKLTADQKAALMVFQDGHAYVNEKGEHRVPIVFDNLIHKGEMPVTIGVFIDPGHKKEKLPEKAGWQPTPENRSFEYDTLSGDYAKFLIEEILPAVVKQHGVRITDDPALRAIGGISSGGICAFTVAWERPDSFRKVLSHVGSFTNIRGGHNYAALIRKTEPKPIRVFLQDGEKDLDNAHGNWWLANLQMEAALKFSKYDCLFVGGTEGHNGKHGGAILPDSLRWLWRDWNKK